MHGKRWLDSGLLRDHLKAQDRMLLRNRCDGVAGWRTGGHWRGNGVGGWRDDQKARDHRVGLPIRHGADIREQVIVGDDCVVGNVCELKQSVLFDRAQVRISITWAIRFGSLGGFGRGGEDFEREVERRNRDGGGRGERIDTVVPSWGH